VSIWIWLCFEDIDAPASAALLIFLSGAFIERALGRRGADTGRGQAHRRLHLMSLHDHRRRADAVG
jgi:hypothetical protein